MSRLAFDCRAKLLGFARGVNSAASHVFELTLALVVVSASGPSVAPARAQSVEELRGLVVRQLSFDGNKAIDDNTLRLSISTSRSSWFARTWYLRWLGLGEKRYFNETEFRRDVLRILALYRQSGFSQASLDTLVRRSAGDVYIQIHISEGDPIRVASLEVNGIDSILPEREWRSTLPLQPGDPFNRLLLQATADTLRIQLANRGYPFAQVFRNFDMNRSERRATIWLEVEPGTQARVARINVAGTDEIDESVVRRSLEIRTGDIFSQRDVYRSQLALYRMGVFNYVNVALADTARGAEDSLVTVRVQVSEGPMHRLRVGAGYGTVDCFRTLGSWTLRNFMGGGRSLELSSRLSQIGAGDPLAAGFEHTICPALADEDTSRLKLNYNLSATLREPFFFSRRTSAALTLFGERRTEFGAYIRRAVGGDASVTLRTAWNVPLTFGYRLSYGNTQADPATFCSFLNVCRLQDTRIFSQNLVRATLSLSAVRDRRNSPLNPSSGNLVTLELRHASKFIGSDSLSQFNKAALEVSSHHRVGRRSVFSWRIKLGTAVSPELGLSGQDLSFIPPEERFYAGGPTTVRGFGQNELGPVVRVLDPTGTDTVEVVSESGVDTVLVGNLRTSPVGGNDLIVANVELRLPLPGFSGRLTGAVFVDAGRVSRRGSEVFDLSGFRITPGAGLRILSPLGPMRLDVAVNPYAVESSDVYVREGGQLSPLAEMYRPARGFLGRFRIHFSVGQAF